MTVKGQINGKLEKIIERMEVGDEGFTVPWALSFLPNADKYDVFLNIKYSVHSKKEDTFELYVKRTGPNDNDFEVDLDSVKNYKWDAGKAHYFGSDESNVVNIGQVDIF